MTVFRSVGTKLSLALVLLVALALGVVYAVVVPSLERNLINEKLRQLEQSAAVIGAQFDGDYYDADLFVAGAAYTTGARVVLFEPLSPLAHELSVYADEPKRSGSNSKDIRNDEMALRATLTGNMESGVVTRGGERYAEVAIPVRPVDGTILLFSASLRDLLANIDLVKRRVLIAGAIALALALLLGYGAAHVFARRIRRLERAADRIASGSFDEPVVDHRSDELGQLARAFERMRGQLAQLERARREFIANASHELRTPIFALGGFLELLDEEVDERTRAEFLATMHEQVERLQKLAADLLDLSRLDAGRLHLEREPVELAQLAAVLTEEFAGVARKTGHELEAAQDGPAVALADELRVLQIGGALLENALVHTPAGTRVRVRTSSSLREARLVVEDTGPGIAPADAEHIFERFYRVDGGMASGSGLGLAIARELAEAMGGRLSVDSRRGRTVFTLALPLAARTGETVDERVPTAA